MNNSQNAPMPVTIVAPDPEEGGSYGLACPVCKGTDIRELDRCERWNSVEWDGERLTIAQQDPDFETIEFFCLHCYQVVVLPDEMVARASWYN